MLYNDWINLVCCVLGLIIGIECEWELYSQI